MFIFSRGGSLPTSTHSPAGAQFMGLQNCRVLEAPRFRVEIGDPDGAYATLDYDSQSGDVTLQNDLSGQLSLRYAQIGDVLYVATHDLLLAPFVPFSIDAASLSNLQRTGWSVGGHSLIQGISTCPPGSRVTIRSNGAVETASLPLPGRTSGIDTMLAYLSDRLPSSAVMVELSAGFDSRAALAATLACKDASDIRAFSEGPANSQDVTVAAEICKRYGISFEHRTTRERRPEDVLNDWSHSAALNNGHIEVNILASRGKPEATVCGDGGEIYRGYFYPYRPFERLRGKTSISPQRVLQKKVGGGDRLTAAITHLSGMTQDPYALLDLFYATDRFGVWNQKLARESSQRISPFYARKAFGAVGHGLDCAVHCALLRRYLPKTMDLPINDEAPPSAYSGGVLKNTALETRILAAKVARRIHKPKDLQTDRANRMDAVLRGLPDDFLHAPATGWADYGAQRFLRLYQEAEASPSQAAMMLGAAAPHTASQASPTSSKDKP